MHARMPAANPAHRCRAGRPRWPASHARQAPATMNSTPSFTATHHESAPYRPTLSAGTGRAHSSIRAPVARFKMRGDHRRAVAHRVFLVAAARQALDDVVGIARKEEG